MTGSPVKGEHKYLIVPAQFDVRLVSWWGVMRFVLCGDLGGAWGFVKSSDWDWWGFRVRGLVGLGCALCWGQGQHCLCL